MRIRCATAAALVLVSGLARADPSAAPPLDPAASERACTDGAIESCARLGRAYRLGNDGVQQDFPRALRLLERACTLRLLASRGRARLSLISRRAAR